MDIEPLVDQLLGPSVPRRREAMKQLEDRRFELEGTGHPAEGKVLKAIIDSLSDNPGVRVTAMKALAEIRTASGRRLIYRALWDNADVVRSEAIKAGFRNPDPPIVEALGQMVDEEPEVKVRLILAKEAPSLREEAGIQMLVRLLSDPGADIREQAVRSLGKLQAEKSAVDLSLMIHREGSFRVSKAVVEVLSQWNSDSAVEGLIWALQHHDDPGIRRHAARGLGRSGSVRASRSLLYAMDFDIDTGVLTECISALGRLGGQVVMERLEALIYESENQDLREKCILSLGEMVSSAPVHDRIVKILTDILDEDHQLPVRAAAARVLGRKGIDRSLPQLIKVTDSSVDPVLRKQAIDALGKLGGVEAEDALCALLESEQDEKVRIHLVHALGEVATVRGVHLLNRMIETEPSPLVQEDMLKILGRIGDEVTLDLLIEMAIRGRQTRMRFMALEALQHRDVPPLELLQCLRDPEEKIKLRALEWIHRRELSSEEEEHFLEELLHLLEHDPQPSLRRASVRALSFRAGSELAPFLLSSLLDSNLHRVHHFCVVGLGRFPIPSARAVLEEFAVIHSQHAFRHACLEALARPAPESTSAVRQSDLDDRMLIRRARALSRLGREIDLGKLGRFLEDEHWLLRWLALDALEHQLKGPLGENLAQIVHRGARDDHPLIRVRSAQLLSTIGGEIARPHLIALSRDGHLWVRWAATLGLVVLLTAEEAGPILRQILDQDGEELVRRAAMQGLSAGP